MQFHYLKKSTKILKHLEVKKNNVKQTFGLCKRKNQKQLKQIYKSKRVQSLKERKLF